MTERSVRGDVDARAVLHGVRLSLRALRDGVGGDVSPELRAAEVPSTMVNPCGSNTRCLSRSGSGVPDAAAATSASSTKGAVKGQQQDRSGGELFGNRGDVEPGVGGQGCVLLQVGQVASTGPDDLSEATAAEHPG